MNFNATTKKIKETYKNQLDGIVNTIEKFRGDRALTFRPLVKVLGMKLTMCLERTEENNIKVMFTDERDNFLLDHYDLNMSSVTVIFNEDDTEMIFKRISEQLSEIINEFILG